MTIQYKWLSCYEIVDKVIEASELIQYEKWEAEHRLIIVNVGGRLHV
jgi:hypothetical protein